VDKIETKKYMFCRYDNPVLTPYNEDDYADQEYVEKHLVVELTDAQYAAHVAVENSYNASIFWLIDKQNEYAKTK
jgi:wyosine [tRNA(Phe)-imidazoG37] synthetase (radical SAM superfamily)